MKQPLILIADDGPHIFASAADLTCHVEVIDVANGEYSAFDSEGCVLSLSIEEPQGFAASLKKRCVVLNETRVFDEEKLRGLLIQHLNDIGKLVDSDQSLTLEGLVQRVMDLGPY